MKKLYLARFKCQVGKSYNTVMATSKSEAEKLMKQKVGSKLYSEIVSWHSGKEAQKIDAELNSFWSAEF